MKPYLILLCCVCLSSCNKRQAEKPPAETEARESVSITEFQEDRKILLGKLGVPFGTIVPVTCRGIQPTESELQMKRRDWEQEIEVTAVNGKVLEKPVRLQWSAREDVAKPVAGASLIVYGYETGMFAGIPDRISDYSSNWQDTAFHFECSFVALTTEPPKTGE